MPVAPGTPLTTPLVTLPGQIAEDQLLEDPISTASASSAVAAVTKRSTRSASANRAERDKAALEKASAQKAGADDFDIDSDDSRPEAARRSKRIGSSFKDQAEAKKHEIAYTGEHAAALLTALGAEAGNAASEASASADTGGGGAVPVPLVPAMSPAKEDEMTDVEGDIKDRLRECEEEQTHERTKRRELQREVSAHAQMLADNRAAMAALSHTTSKIIDALAKDEALWQHTVVAVKKKTLRMREYYEKMTVMQTHLKSKTEIWPNILTIASSGPATTIVAKTKDSAQAVLDTVKVWSQTEGIGRELAIFRGKENMKRFREKPLVAMRNALSEEFGTRVDAGMRLACVPHWPEFFSPDWSISAQGSILCWSELQPDGFTMHIYANSEHPVVFGQKGKLMNALTAADAECSEALYYCIFAIHQITPASVIRGRGTDFNNGGKGRGKGKGRGRVGGEAPH